MMKKKAIPKIVDKFIVEFKRLDHENGPAWYIGNYPIVSIQNPHSSAEFGVINEIERKRTDHKTLEEAERKALHLLNCFKLWITSRENEIDEV